MSGDNNSGGHSLGGGAGQPLPAGWQRPTNSAPRVGRIGDWSGSAPSSQSNRGGSRFGTLRDLGSSAPSGGGSHAHDDDDDDEDDPNAEGESWFAGGERSGINIENPDRARVPGGNTVRDILRRAELAGPPPSASGSSRTTAFHGGGYKLGSDEVESTYIPDPDAPPADAEEVAIRHVTFWRDGFSVEDGELMRYDENEQVLADINSGRAAPHILNVLPGQPVELRMTRRLTEEYVAAPRRPGTFTGAGHRLGAPVPGLEVSGGTSGAMPGSFPTNPAPASSSQVGDDSELRSRVTTRFEVDQSLPTTSVQVRLADGTRMVCRMNLTHTVLDLRNFINASRPENLTRPYTIGTTFPNRTLEDDTATIKDAGLVNSVIVQRWV